MPGIRNIAHITHFIPQVHEVTVNDVESNEGACVAEMTFAADRRSADIHARITRNNRLESLFLPCIGVEYF